VLINSNKNSLLKESQYSLRRDVLKEAEKRNQSILLAGPGWELSTLSNIREDFNLLSDCLKSKNTPSFRNFRFPKLNFDSVEYLGYLNDKNSFYKHVSVCICIENDKNHFTEKLFDCIQAGVLPLYVGPKLSRHEIPDELAIECDHDAKSILDTYSSLSLNEILEFKLHASDWVKSAFTDWHEDTVMNIIAFKIKNFIDSRNFS
jgi:hypothetical protein